jgi:hypothetical protein
VLAAGVVVGCDPIGLASARQVALADAEDVLETAYCERMFSCSCEEGRRFESVDACMIDIRAQVAALEAQPGGKSIFYDPFCLGEKVDAFDELGCALPSDDDDVAECERPCFIYHGDVREGRTCHTTEDGQYSDCSKRLVCGVTSCPDGEGVGCNGICVDPCENPNPSPCGACDAQSVCDEGSGTCVPLPELAPLDEPCSGHTDCASGFCPAGFCATLPVEGESCASGGMCVVGSRCDATTTTCVPADALFCSLPAEIE